MPFNEYCLKDKEIGLQSVGLNWGPLRHYVSRGKADLWVVWLIGWWVVVDWLVELLGWLIGKKVNWWGNLLISGMV